MDLLWDGFRQSLKLLIHGDPEVVRVTLLSLMVSGSATAISLLIGVSVGTFLAFSSFFGRRFLISLVNTGMGLPPTVVGLFVSILLWRSGPLGLLHLIYTPGAMIVAQTLLATPIVTGFTLSSLQSLNPKLRTQILALGASRLQMLWLLLRESRLLLLAAVMAGFGAVISEVGASLMVGGNIQGQTRVLTTAVVLAVSRGDFSLAIALSLILLVLVYLVNLILTTAQQRGRPQ